MAGAGYKLFNTGDVLTAAQVNTYLQEQAVMRFANAAARTTALSGVLAEGMMSYLDDTNSVEVYNGSTWVSVGSTGDITGVTAGTGISGGGTSGDVTVTNSMATAIDAKGDLIVGTGSDTFSRLAVGTNNQVLTADSTTATGLKWAAASSGKVLQIVNATYATSVNNSTDTFADTGLSASITPSATSSTILVLLDQNVVSGTGTTWSVWVKLFRGSTEILSLGDPFGFIWANPSYGNPAMATISYIDSPASTSSLTYKSQFRRIGGGTATAQGGNTQGGRSSITLIEIGA